MVATIVGMSGFARSGKDTAADVLVNEYDFTRVAFADKLRQMLYELNPLVEQRYTEVLDPMFLDPVKIYDKRVYVQDVIDKAGWDGYKETKFGSEIRRLLQRLGTEAGRKTLWDTIWIDAAFAGVESNKIVVTDARFFNEFDAVRDRGGVIWRVEREGVGPANGHASELEAIDYPHFGLVIANDGTLEEYEDKVRQHAEILLHGKVSE